MALCAYCNTRETIIYERDVPMCVECADSRSKPKFPATDSRVRTMLLQDVLEWTSRIQAAKKELDAAKTEASRLPQSDGTRHIKNASRKLAATGNEYAKAHTRLARYFTSGIEPEDLQRRTI